MGSSPIRGAIYFIMVVIKKMKLEDLPEFSAKDFIEQLYENSKASEGYPYSYYKKYLKEVLGVPENKSIPQITVELREGLNIPARTIVKRYADKYIKMKAIEDLMYFSLLLGVDAYQKLTEDKKDIEAGMYFNHISTLHPEQDIIITLSKNICPFIDQPDIMSRKLANLAEAHGEYTDPLAVMNDEMGAVEGYHISD